MARRPIVLIPACNQQIGDHPFHVAGRKYADAVRLAGALPLVVPRALPEEIDELLDLADGVLLTGSPSNVHPSNFGEAVHDPSLPLDPERDDWTLPLIRRVLARGVPLFSICRGTQEVNVALGGSLHQAVQEVPGHADHRGPKGQGAETTYGIAHRVDVVPGGLLDTLVGRPSFEVNSVHGQGIDAPGRRPARRGAGPRRPGRGVHRAGRPGLQSLRAVAPGMAGRVQPGLDAVVRRVRPRRAHLSRPRARPFATDSCNLRLTQGSGAAP